MKPTQAIFVFALLLLASAALQAQESRDRFKQLDKNNDGKLTRDEMPQQARGRFEQMNANRDGFVTGEEMDAFGKGRNRDTPPIQPQRGDEETKGDDGTVSATAVPGIVISLSQCPVKDIKVKASDGRVAKARYRVPPGTGPFPAIIFIHGGARQASDRALDRWLTGGAVVTRFLAAGFVTVHSTFRTYADELQSEGPILDNIAIYEHAKKMPEVDAQSIVFYGGSGGGAMTLNLTTRLNDLPAAAAGEPVGTIFLGLMEKLRGANRLAVNSDPQGAWDAKPESFRQAMRAKLKKMSCPVLIMQGNVGNTFRYNNALLYPELKRAGADFDLRNYPNMYHGFYWGNGETTTTEVVERVVKEAVEFFSQHVAVKPRPGE